jgi:hypothetical protein
LEKAETERQTVKNRKPYRIDGEAGRFGFASRSVFDEDGKIVFNSATDIFPGLTSKEYYRTAGFKQLAYIYGDTEQSFRKTADLINRIRHQENDGTPYRTLQEATQREGETVLEYIREKTERRLFENNFDENGQPISLDENYSRAEIKAVDKSRIYAESEKLSEQYDVEKLMENPVPFESADSTVNVSIDDVVVKRQEKERSKNKEFKESKRKYAHNTICHIEKAESGYTLNAGTIMEALLFLSAFILENDLLRMRIQFFTDGRKSLNEAVLKFFSWFGNIGIILDWYHLHKKCKEQLSMALKGRHIRNDILDELMPLLWHGLTADATAYLRGISKDSIKNSKMMEKMITCLERNTMFIPCYALRKRLGLRNGSSIGEKMNDLIVSERQKHNGMAWSKCGSVALAALTALKRNKESDTWFERKELNFRLAA